MEMTETIRESVTKVGKMLGMDTMTSEYDPIAFLTAQHREVDALFAALEDVGEKAYKTKDKIAVQICEKLKTHARLEEHLFYPQAREADKDLVLEAAEEHQNIKTMIRRIESTDPSDETFMPKLVTLKELVRHHFKEEENELFPKCRTVFSDEKMKEMGHAIAERAERLGHVSPQA